MPNCYKIMGLLKVRSQMSRIKIIVTPRICQTSHHIHTQQTILVKFQTLGVE